MPGGTGGPTARALEAWAAAQPSLWDAAIAAAAVMAPRPRPRSAPALAPVLPPTPKPLRTAPLPVGKRPERGARVVVDGETLADGSQDTYAYMGAMACGREREYALLVRWDARDDAMAPRRCVSIEHVRMVVMDADGE